MQRIAIMGAGSLGTILGAFISKSGRQIDLIDANKAHVEALNKDGAKVVGTIEMTAPVTAITPDQMEGKYDLFIYMAKQTYNDACLPKMLEHSHDKTIVCTCQNGLPEPAVCEVFPQERVLGAPVNWGATYLSPGVSESTTNRELQSFTLGTVLGPVTPELLEVKEILEAMCRVDISENLMGLRWTKLLINAAYSGMSTVIGGTYGDISDNPRAMSIAVRIGRECIRACAADGSRMEPFHLPDGEIDWFEVYDFKTLEEEAACMKLCTALNAGSRPLVASMLQDLRKGLACEVDAINGVVAEAGKRNGVPTPYSDAAVKVIKMKQAGEIDVEACPLEMFPTEL